MHFKRGGIHKIVVVRTVITFRTATHFLVSLRAKGLEGDFSFIMPGSAADDPRRQTVEHGHGSALCELQFDPMELWGTQIPFVDPFNYEHTLRADDPAATPLSMNGALLSIMSEISESDDGHLRLQDPYHCTDHQDPLPSRLPWPQRIVQYTASAIDTRLEPQSLLEPGPEVVPRLERVKLRPDQAIYIFQQRRTKTSRTAALLSVQFGITPKAIRDIWVQRSWAHETRGLETHLDV